MSGTDSGKLLRIAAKIYERLSSMKALQILNQEFCVKAPELLCEYSVVTQIGSSSTTSKLPIGMSEIIGIRARSLDDYSDESQAILKNPDGFVLCLDRIKAESRRVLWSFEYRLASSSLLESLVHKDSQRDLSKSGGDADEYWIHAQLIEPKWFRLRKYGRLDLRDIDVNVNVAVHQDLKTAIPKGFIRNLQLIKEWIRTKDRVQKWRLSHEHLNLGAKPYTGKEEDILAEMQRLFLPSGFRTFVEVSDPFHYHDAIRGADFYDLPFSTFPKTMRVIARTNLNLDNPAAEGRLVYKKDELRDEVEKIVGELQSGNTRHVSKTGKSITIKAVRREPLVQRNMVSIRSDIEKKLRPTIRERPNAEKEVSDALENLFLALDYDFKRERVSFPYSSKSYIPDFTSDSLSIALDVKLCASSGDEKEIVDQISSDILAYKTRYKFLLFVVYDVGWIRNVESFAGEIEKNNENVEVLVIKH